MQVALLPKDFKGNNGFNDNTDCPVARAVKRHFKVKKVFVFSYGVQVGKTFYNIKGKFEYQDYVYVKEAYKADPKAEDTIFEITLEKQPSTPTEAASMMRFCD